MPLSLAGAAKDMQDGIGAVDVHSDISEPDTSDDEVERSKRKAAASKDLEGRMARIKSSGFKPGLTKPHWTRERPEDQASDMATAAVELRGAFAADYDVEDSPAKRVDSPAMPRQRNATQNMLEEAARRLSPEPPVLSWRRGDEVLCKFRATGKWVDACVLGPAAATAKGPAGYDVKYKDGGVVERHVPPTLLRPRAGAERDDAPSKAFGRVDAPAAPKPPRPSRPAPARPREAKAPPPADVAQDQPLQAEAKAPPPADVAQDQPARSEAKAPPPASVAQDAPTGQPEPKPARVDAPPARPGAKAAPPAHIAQDAAPPASEPKPTAARDAPAAKAPPPPNVAQDAAPPQNPARPAEDDQIRSAAMQMLNDSAESKAPIPPTRPEAKAPPPPTVAQDAPPQVPRPPPEEPWVPKRANIEDEEKDEPLPSDGEASEEDEEDASPPVFVGAEDLAPRWHRGDRALVRDGATSTYLEGTVVHTLPNGGAAVKFGAEVVDVDAGRLREPEDVSARAVAAASTQLRAFLLSRAPDGNPTEQRKSLVRAFKEADADRSGTMDRAEFRSLLKDAGLKVDVDRASARADTKEVRCRAPKTSVELDHAAVAVLVARRAGGDVRAGDELLAVGERTVEQEADRLWGDDELDLATLPAAMLQHQGTWRVRRTAAKYLSRREADALARAVGLAAEAATSLDNIVAFAFDDAPEGAEPELAVAMDACATSLRGGHVDDVDAAFDACRRAIGTRNTTLETTKLVSYLCSTELDLPSSGYGRGGPHDDGAGTPSKRSLTSKQAHLIARRCLDASGDGVITKSEFAAFAFWPTRSVEALRRAALTAAYALPDDGAELTPGRRLFSALDEDGNGCLGRAELARGLAFLGAPLLPDERKLLSDALDGDGDGATTRKEFLAFLGEKVDDLDDRPVPQKMRVPVVPKTPTRRACDRRKPEAAYHPKPQETEKTKKALAVWIARCLALEEDNRELTLKVRDAKRALEAAAKTDKGDFYSEAHDVELAAECSALAAKNDVLTGKLEESEAREKETVAIHEEEKERIKSESETNWRDRVRAADAAMRKADTAAKQAQRELAKMKALKPANTVVKDAYFSKQGSNTLIKQKEKLADQLAALKKSSAKEIADLKSRLKGTDAKERALHKAWRAATDRGEKLRQAVRDAETDCANRLRRMRASLDEARLKVEGVTGDADTNALMNHPSVVAALAGKQETRAFRGRRQFPDASTSRVEIS